MWINSYSQSTDFRAKKILIYTKNGEGYKHENIPTSTNALIEICKAMGVEAQVSENPVIFTQPELNHFDAILFNNTNNEVFDTPQQKEAFKRFCLSGKGFGGIHSAIGSQRNWPWFWKLIGGSFLRHPPFQTFKVRVHRKRHPSTRHLKNSFEVEDECYIIKNSNQFFKVLLKADLTTVTENRNEKHYPTSYAPLSWYNTFGGGKQWVTLLGHSKNLYALPWFQKHLKGGIEYLLKN